MSNGDLKKTESAVMFYSKIEENAKTMYVIFRLFSFWYKQQINLYVQGNGDII